MLVGISGTPGTGKTSVSYLLKKNGYKIVDLNKTAIKKGFITGIDKKRNSKIIDIDRLDTYIKEKYADITDIIFVEGHIAHLLQNIDKIIILRCHPDELKKRLIQKKWRKEKIMENIEAEILDIILCETTDIHPEENIFEIDTTQKPIETVAGSIIEIIKNEFKPMKKYNIGKIDWSEEILKKFQ
ncbi:MAG: hypothetical protein DRN05_00570 [Thermoplasmata archaeon]|nr:MAG: hypothetical protein DRN05_00570 [Thermoplasmata archaeon]